MRIAPHTPQCTSIAIPHKPQSSILNPHCTTKCGTFMFVPHVPQMWYKCGTQKGPHTFFRWFGYYALNVCIYPWKFWNKVFTILNFDFWWPLTSHTCIDIIIFILHTYPSAPKWGTFDIGAPSAPNGALNGALNGGTKLDIFQKKFSLMFVRVIHLKVNLGQLMKIFIFFF